MRLATLALFTASTLSINSAAADFLRWSAEIENDPFSGGRKVLVNMSTIRSGVFIVCDTAEPGVRVRAVPGWAYVPDLALIEPTIEFAFDGERLLGAKGTTGAVGDNIAAAEVLLQGDQARQFVSAFASAQRQVAIKDGISDQPHLLKASGSTKAGEALVGCLDKQT
ncbi:hypothetical protein [Arvimicrobium flavum]|uniref:hypothetical protein n=1 Tax=Arvimicrobium flavum TaxID=3393320 RepID=UPI00237A4B3D|nr:hypothetical protein [Mesorhizobium shangrilense]